MKKIIDFAHQLLKEHLKREDVAVDMTVGNGNDTIFLSTLCSHVYGFDIQKQAIDKVTALLQEKHIDNVTLLKKSHDQILQFVHEPVKAFIFNLGYLPGGDKSITTKKNTTLKAVLDALTILAEEGVLVLVCYPGHLEGKKEALSLIQMLQQFPQQQYEVLQYSFINQIHEPPFLLAVERRKK